MGNHTRPFRPAHGLPPIAAFWNRRVLVCDICLADPGNPVWHRQACGRVIDQEVTVHG